jgi:hypothetical protein
VTDRGVDAFVTRVSTPGWTYTLSGSGGGMDRFFDLGFDPDGNVVGVGYRNDDATGFDAYVVRLAR